MSSHSNIMKKFMFTCLFFQVIFGAAYVVLVRYGDSANAKHFQNQLHGEEQNEDLKENVAKYPMIIDVHMMLIGGFGFLMTFLKRYGFSSLGLTFIVVTLVTEWALLVRGLTHMDHSNIIKITILEVLEGGFASAAVLISLGAVLGKLNPFQILLMSLIEAPVFVLNSYIGYTILGVADIGGAIFIHAFGAYFGLAVSMMHRHRDVGLSGKLEGSSYSSDIFSLIGTVILWVYWPSFNGVLANDDAQHRAFINTYISLIASTLATFIISAMFGGGNKFDVVDFQNATLSGGVAVGAIADLMIQPGGAFIAGTICGIVSTLGYRVIQGKLFDRLKLHDTCGVNNLHGMPGVISGLASILMVVVANEDLYGPSLYLIYPRCSPNFESEDLKRLQALVPSIEDGEGRTVRMQAIYQLIGLIVTLSIAMIGGALTGLLLKLDCINDGLEDYELFDDDPFWNLPEDAFDITGHDRHATDTNLCKSDTKLPFCDSCKFAKVCRCSLKTVDKESNKNLEENGPYLTMNI